MSPRNFQGHSCQAPGRLGQGDRLHSYRVRYSQGIGSGEVLVRNNRLSLDLRTCAEEWMTDLLMRRQPKWGPSWSAARRWRSRRIEQREVLDRRPSGWLLGWQPFAASTGVGLTKIDTRVIPASAYLGAVGMPSVTAWLGMTQIAEPKPGETVVVSASFWGTVRFDRRPDCEVQVARSRRRCCGWGRKVPLCGGGARLDACVDYKLEDFDEALEGGDAKRHRRCTSRTSAEKSSRSATRRLNPFARIPLCGPDFSIQRTAAAWTEQSAQAARQSRALQGFVVSDRLDLWPGCAQGIGWHGLPRAS